MRIDKLLAILIGIIIDYHLIILRAKKELKEKERN